jgi:flagellar capping protein FliD
MSSIVAWAEMLIKLVKIGGVVINIGRDQLIKKLNNIRENLEQFKEAAEQGDASKMRQLLEECRALSEDLERRMFKGLDDKTSKAVAKAVVKARSAKQSLTRAPASKTAPKAAARKAVENASYAKGDALAIAVTTNDQGSRQELIEEIDIAIGRLRGVSKSLASSKW